MEDKTQKGHTHPLVHMEDEAVRLFASLGFETVWGPEGGLMPHVFALQERLMQTHKPPFKALSIGRFFCDDQLSIQSHLIAGLVVDKNVTLAYMKGVVGHFLRKLYGDDVKIQIRSGFFPFVEPGVQVDVACFHCGGAGCETCKMSGWIKVFDAGMVHPDMLKKAGIDPAEWRGFAFSADLETLAMLRYGVGDRSLFTNGDVRLVNQF